MKLLASSVSALIGVVIAYLAWGPLLHFLWSMIPATAQNAWMGKLACLFIVGWVGGIGLPLVFIGFSVYVLIA